MCPDKTCMPAGWECDGVADCADGADEMFCGGRDHHDWEDESKFPIVFNIHRHRHRHSLLISVSIQDMNNHIKATKEKQRIQ